MDAQLDRRGPAGEHGHILIAGVGRAGTTLLVQWFTALGFDTGWSLEEALAGVDAISGSGLERSLGRGNLAYVSKSPWYSENLGRALDADKLSVQAVGLPIRELYGAAESRRSVSRRALEAGLDPDKHPGGVSFRAKRNPARQEQRLGVTLYTLVHALAVHGVPTYLLPFPEFTADPAVLYARLEPLLATHGVTRAESDAALARVLDPSKIHNFTLPTPNPDSSSPRPRETTR